MEHFDDDSYSSSPHGPEYSKDENWSRFRGQVDSAGPLRAPSAFATEPSQSTASLNSPRPSRSLASSGAYPSGVPSASIPANVPLARHYTLTKEDPLSPALKPPPQACAPSHPSYANPYAGRPPLSSSAVNPGTIRYGYPNITPPSSQTMFMDSRGNCGEAKPVYRRPQQTDYTPILLLGLSCCFCPCCCPCTFVWFVSEEQKKADDRKLEQRAREWHAQPAYATGRSQPPPA